MNRRGSYAQSNLETVTRFAFKVVVTLVLGSIGTVGRAVGVDGWMLFYAALCMLFAWFRGESIHAPSFTYWDEMLWFLAIVSALHMSFGGTD